MSKAADIVEQTVQETLTYYAFPDIHWQKIRTNNPLERIMREIRRRTRVVGAFPDGQSCLNLWGTRVSPSTASDLNKKIYGTIEAWRNRPIEGEHPYVYLDGIVLKRSWAGEVRNVSLLVAIGVNESGYREILGICEGAKEDKSG